MSRFEINWKTTNFDPPPPPSPPWRFVYTLTVSAVVDVSSAELTDTVLVISPAYIMAFRLKINFKKHPQYNKVITAMVIWPLDDPT